MKKYELSSSWSKTINRPLTTLSLYLTQIHEPVLFLSTKLTSDCDVVTDIGDGNVGKDVLADERDLMDELLKGEGVMT